MGTPRTKARKSGAKPAQLGWHGVSAFSLVPLRIGIVATAALLGSSVLTLAVGLLAPRHDLRKLLILGAGLMTATGLAFPQFEHIAFIGLVAFVGTVNPSTGDSGILVPLEIGRAHV